MENTKKETSETTKNITLGIVLGWIFGVLFIITGVSLVSSSIAGGLLVIVGGLILIPVINSLIREKLKFNLSGGLRVVIAIILFVTGAMMSNSGDKKDVVGTVMDEKTTETTVPEKKEEAPAEKQWVKVTELTAGANKQSDTFTLEGGQQKVKYTVTGTNFSMCSVYVMDEGESLTETGGFPIVMVTEPKTDETMMRKSSGDYYLDLQVANANCKVELYEQR